MKKVVWVFLGSGLLFSCGGGERVSKEVFDEVNNTMEVKRLTEVEIQEEAMIWGDSITQEAQSNLLEQLQNAISEKGVSGAIEFCKISAFPILEEVATKHGVSVRRVSNDYRNPADQPDSDEEPILEAYEYNAENGLQSDPNIQKLKNGEILLYTKAIVIPGGLCLNCHGEPGKDINAETQKTLETLYPQDLAVGHKVGDLRGMWAVRIPKKEVVNRL
ncbi:MAG: DUF3365 domain-containing protein [Cyclobacteriaceae bacterium]|nr:DUF3365 domain-containing protein [Cyclobacteriaceae bacterium]MDX5468120.1 DUF3365 domain-containing protein [Cyclobacteriaceae bacterium]